MIKEATSVSFDEALSNKSSEELLKSLADNSDQESDIETDIDSGSDNPEPTLRIQRPVSHLKSPLSSLSFLSLWPKLSTLPQ